ncbi:MAG: hypothetical protein ABEK42_12005, partial [Thiohalorhabdaceae bacterium]
WGRFYRGAGDAGEALRSLHAEEARLFGAAADGQKGTGQSLFLMRLQEDGTRPGKPVSDWPRNGTGNGFLGFGL